jgi:hypothetical protein
LAARRKLGQSIVDDEGITHKASGHVRRGSCGVGKEKAEESEMLKPILPRTQPL